MNEINDSKKLFLTVAAVGGIQTFFVMVLGAMVVFKSAEWVLLGCLLLFSLINLGATLTIGSIVARLVDSTKRLSGTLLRYGERVDALLNGRRGDGLMEVRDVSPFAHTGAASQDYNRRNKD